MLLSGAGGELRPEPATRYLYLDHWAYRYIDLLQDRGHLGGLDRSVRPYTRGEVAREIARLGRAPGRLGSVERGWLGLLETEFEEEIRRVRDGGEGSGYYLRGVFREDADVAGDDGDADYLLQGEALLRSGALVLSTRMSVDQSLFDDPFYRGRKDISLAGRVEDAYLLGRFSRLTLFFGRTARSWSPVPGRSLVLSGDPFSYDHLFLRVGGPRLSLRSVFARLSDLPSGAASAAGEQRYLAAHRLDFRVGNWLQAGVFESAVYGGKGAGVDLALLNPLIPYIVVENATSRQLNSFLGFDVYVRPRPGVSLSLQLLIDDVKLKLFGRPVFFGGEVEPNEFGLSIGVTVADPFGLPNTLLRGGYRKVTNFTYNAPDSVERYLQEGIGLGAGDGNDFDEITAEFEFFPRSAWIATLSTGYRRRGQGRVDDPFPASFESDDVPFPSGVVERTFALSGGIRYQRSAAWFLSGSLGFEDVRNRGHETGVDVRELRGELTLELSAWGWIR
jgi:hypothetical protein